MSLDIKNRLEQNNLDTVFPEDVFNEYAKQIVEETNFTVTVSVNPFEREIESYSYNYLTQALSTIMGATEHNVQDDLGMIGNAYNTKFEFLIGAKDLPDFRFRLFLAGCELSGYPCKIVLEQGFADAINKKIGRDGYIYTVSNSQELRELLLLIFNSEKFIILLQQIITISTRQKNNKCIVESNFNDE